MLIPWSAGVLAASGAARPSGHAASGGGWLLPVLAVLAAAGWWAWHAWRHPYGPCWTCQGTGRNMGSTGKRFGDCRVCKRTGRRLRLGARLFHKGIARVRGRKL